MVNASLNWASLVGLLLLVWWLVAVPAAGLQAWFLLMRRIDTTPQVLAKVVFRIVAGLGRLLGLPVAAGILFFQGWRLDPILQFAFVLLAGGVIVESFAAVVADYQAWCIRTGGARR